MFIWKYEKQISYLPTVKVLRVKVKEEKKIAHKGIAEDEGIKMGNMIV